MGLMDKVTDKLGSNKSEEQSYDQQHDSSMQHPISGSTSRPTGTALDSKGNTPSTAGRDGYGTTTSPTYGGQDNSSSMPGGFPSGTQTDRLRDGGGTSSTQHGGTDAFGSDKYGTQSSTLRHGTDPNDVTRGTDTYGALPSRDHHTSAADRVPMTGTGGTTTTTTHGPSTTTTAGYGQPRKPVDPYSPSGQQAAAEGASHDRPNDRYASGSLGRDDPSINRSNNGGVLNQHNDRYNDSGSHGRDAAYGSSGDRYGHSTSTSDRHPTGASAERYGTSTNDRSPISGSHAAPFNSEKHAGTTSSSNHYGRDAAIGSGAAGAGGLAAHEYDSRGHRNTSNTHGQQYGSRDEYSSGRDGYRSSSRDGRGIRENPYHSAYGGSQSQSRESNKASHAWDAGYDAGYRDAMDYFRSEGRNDGYGRNAGHGRNDGYSKNDGYGRNDGYDRNEANAGKPSMMDKLNPKKDANGDGQTGFMK